MDRRNFLECMAWAGSGVVWSMAGGVATSSVLGAPRRAAAAAGAFTFVQISDTHVGYKGAASSRSPGSTRSIRRRPWSFTPATSPTARRPEPSTRWPRR